MPSTNLVLLALVILLFAIVVKLVTSDSTSSEAWTSLMNPIVFVIACVGLVVGVVGVLETRRP